MSARLVTMLTALAADENDNSFLSRSVGFVGGVDSTMAMGWSLLTPEKTLRGDKEKESLTRDRLLLEWIEAESNKGEGEKGVEIGDHTEPDAGGSVEGLLLSNPRSEAWKICLKLQFSAKPKSWWSEVVGNMSELWKVSKLFIFGPPWERERGWRGGLVGWRWDPVFGLGLSRSNPFLWLNPPMKFLPRPNSLFFCLCFDDFFAVAAAFARSFGGTLSFAWWAVPQTDKMVSFIDSCGVGISAYQIAAIEVMGNGEGSMILSYVSCSDAADWILFFFPRFGVSAEKCTLVVFIAAMASPLFFSFSNLYEWVLPQ